VTEWDTSKEGYGEVEGRKPPEPRLLANYTTVVWNVDFNNGVGSPTGLWRTLVGGAYSELSGYLRAGGTMILSGFLLGGNVISPNTVLYGNVSRGICFALEPGTTGYFLGAFRACSWAWTAPCSGGLTCEPWEGRTSSKRARPLPVSRWASTRWMSIVVPSEAARSGSPTLASVR
jgi:hypothetical protein